MRYIAQCLEFLITEDYATMEPRQDLYDDWHERSQREIKMLGWSQPTVKHSFYKNADGEIHIVSPWRLVDYWGWTKEIAISDFIVQ